MILILFTTVALSQEIVEKSINSESEKILVEFDLIDHIELFNSDSESRIVVKAEGSEQTPNFQITEINGYVLLKDFKSPSKDVLLERDKVCSVEPNYTSYEIYVPRNKNLYIAVIEGNFYASNFDGNLNLKLEDGTIKLNGMNKPVSVQLNSGSIFVHDIINTKIDAETNMGILVHNLTDKSNERPEKKLNETIGDAKNSLLIRAILANIYLYGSKS